MVPRSRAAISRCGPPDLPRRYSQGDEWRKWPSVKAILPNLPPGTTTYEIHKNLKDFGKLEYIAFEEGTYGRRAHVTFKPPPPKLAPWDPSYCDGIDFELPGRENPVKILVLYNSNQQPIRLVESPVCPSARYSPEMTLHAEAIDFGFLERPTSMVIKATKRGPYHGSIRLSLNLNRLEMEVHFPIIMASKGKSSKRAYRFFVALDDQFTLFEARQSGKTFLILHIKNPPWYSRQLKEAMQMSHDPKSRKWSAEDTWSRQTDIVDNKETYEKINKSPVSLQKLHNSIDISRWTTFRVTVQPTTDTFSNSPQQQFLQALADFNIPLTRHPSFNATHSPAGEAPVWRLLDGAQGIPQSLTEQLSTIYLPFDLRYQLEVCISHGWLNEFTLDEAFLRRLADLPPQRAKQMLIHVDSYQQRVYDPMDIFENLRYSKPVKARPLPPNCVELPSATITATGILFHTPSVEITNRIIRKYQRYSNRFMRVRFEDDAYRGRTRLYPTANGRMKLIFDRVRRTLKHGIVMGDRHYEFLAYGNSQLREHGAFFFAKSHNPHIDADAIRKGMGVFDNEKVVAKRAARMGQCFSTTKPVKVISRHTWKQHPIPDIIHGPYNFTDGVGKLSILTARLVYNALKLCGEVPCAFQFRLGGCKGVLVVDPSLTGVDVKIRPSQYKFDCESDELEIIRVAEFWQPFLNRQIILVLSALGIPDEVFLRKQEACIQALDRALVDDTAALRSLRENVDPNLATLTIATMIEAGFRQTNDMFVTSLLRLYRAWTLKYLKEKARIPVPQGAFVLGVADETQQLRGHVNEMQLKEDASKEEMENALPEIFMQYTDPQTGKRRIVEGICLIGRNPALHHGDIRVVKAVDMPALHHLYDVVVMPTAGDRDLPSMCSGGDLDGDDYFVIWDPELLPKEWHVEPFEYEAPEPITKDEISTEDIVNFFCDYMQNDFLGRIAVAHLAHADHHDDGVRSEECVQLVQKHSVAVDYPKTGVPAEMPRDLEPVKWPHFMERKGGVRYRSRKVLGRLYDAVEQVSFKPNWAGTFDRRILDHKLPSALVLERTIELKKSYDESMRRIMAQHQIRTEFEVWSTFVLHHSKAARDYKFHEEIGQHSKSLKEQYHKAFREEAGGHEFEKLVPFAVAAYHVTYNEVRQSQEQMNRLQEEDDDSTTSDAVEMPLISFPWVLQDVLCKIVRDMTPEHFESNTVTAEVQPSTSREQSEKVEAALEVLDNGEGVSTWKYFGEHLPDPYVPAASNSENKSPEVDLTVSPDQLTSKQASLSPLPQLTPGSFSKLRAGEGHSASENSSIISNVHSMGAYHDSASTTSDDAVPPHSSLSHRCGSPAAPRSSGPGLSKLSQQPVLSNSTNAPKAEFCGQLRLGDPALTTERQLPFDDDDDDDDDYAF